MQDPIVAIVVRVYSEDPEASDLQERINLLSGHLNAVRNAIGSERLTEIIQDHYR